MRRVAFWMALCVWVATGLTAQAQQTPAPKPAATAEAKWQPLFNGKNLDNWKKTNFGGEGEVTVADGILILDQGQPLTGLTWKAKDPPHKIDYEIRLEAKRVKGTDFFVALTFPVNDSHCSLIVGGWGGGVVGLSSINNFDASENPTTSYHEFKNDQWYKFRVKVTKAKIECWMDDKQIIDQEIGENKISTRIEVDDSKPLGLATYETKAAIKGFEIRPVK